jgi:hypothetical protein
MAGTSYDINGMPLFWDGTSKFFDTLGNDVTATKIAYSVQRGDVTGINIAAVGIQTAVVTFTEPFDVALQDVSVNLKDLSATDAIISQVWTSNETINGFTINVHVTTASVTGGSTAKCHWVSTGY